MGSILSRLIEKMPKRAKMTERRKKDSGDKKKSKKSVAVKPRKRSPVTSAYASKGVILPLVKTLRDLTANQRTFVLAHLDDKSLRTLCRVVDKVLHSGERIPSYWKSKLVQRLKGEKCAWRRLCSDKLSPASARKHLLRMGGKATFRSILHTAIPLYSTRV